MKLAKPIVGNGFQEKKVCVNKFRTRIAAARIEEEGTPAKKKSLAPSPFF